MQDKYILKEWVLKALEHHNGKAHLTLVSKYIWENYQNELRDLGMLFYTWQYDMRWAAQKLRDDGILKKIPKKDRAKGIWEIA